MDRFSIIKKKHSTTVGKIYSINIKYQVNIKSRFSLCPVKKVFLEILQNSQRNTCAGASVLIKLQASSSVFLCILQNFNTFFAEHLRTTAPAHIKQHN